MARKRAVTVKHAELGLHEQSFVDFAQRVGSLYASLDVRVLSVRLNGRWHNLATTAELRPYPPSRVPRVQNVQTEHIGVWQSVVPADRLREVVSSLAIGKLRVGRRTIHCLSDIAREDVESRPYQFWEPWLIGTEGRYWRGERRWSVNRLTARGDRGQVLLHSGGLKERALDLK